MASARDPSLLPPPPRRIRRRRGYFQIVWGHFLLVVVLLFLQVFWFISIGTIRFLWFSTIVQARVTKILVSPGKHGPSYALQVAYQFEHTDYSSQVDVGPYEARALREGDTVQLQMLPERPDRPQLFQEHYPNVLVSALLALFTLIPTLGVGKMLWQLYGRPWQMRTLMREGMATSAKIVDKKEIAGRPPTHRLTYAYSVPFGMRAAEESGVSTKVQASMQVSPEDFLESQIGDEVIVLYRPARPRRSILCRYADYEFVTSAMMERPSQLSGPEIPRTWHWLAIAATVGLVFLGIAKFSGWW